MDYKNTEIKLETLVTYFNEERINLNPVFQRGSVWTLPGRQKLIKNVVMGRPIPAIFVYKDEDGSKYTFNILDGKQRLESILLFVGHARADFRINTWAKYIHTPEVRKEVNFAAPVGEDAKSQTLAQLSPEVVRNLREYPIPMIEITMNESTSIDEIISLFVDINQQGVKVTRLQIVRALKRNDKFLKDVYGLIAVKQRRAQAIFPKKKNTDYTYVLKRLQMVSSTSDPDQQADRMWQILFELALFVRSNGKHRKPTEILKSFIKSPGTTQEKLSAGEKAKLSKVFRFLSEAYREDGLAETRFAKDQTHFYTMVTCLLSTDLLDAYLPKEIATAICDFDGLLSRQTMKVPAMPRRLAKYKELSAKQTSDSTRRDERGRVFVEAVQSLIEFRGGARISTPARF